MRSRTSNPAEAAAVVAVTNCNNTGPGSLREAVATAASGSIIDIGSLPCWIIPLAGNIVVPQADLTITGSRDHRIIVDGTTGGGYSATPAREPLN